MKVKNAIRKSVINKSKILVKTALLSGVVMASVPGVVLGGDKASCFWQAEEVRPALTAPEKEAFIANCKANATIPPRKTQRRDN